MNSTEQNFFLALTEPANLMPGWQRVLANRGGPGGDGERVQDILPRIGSVLSNLAADLASGTYCPGPYRHVQIPKKRGGTRQLSIPCVRDRIVQSAVAQLIEPLAEAEFEDSSFGYRRGRGVKQAVATIEALHREGFDWVVEADIESFFDSVPHDRIQSRFVDFTGDPELGDLLQLWLSAGDDKTCGLGLPQGSPLAPLLANLYLDSLDEAFDKKGLRIIRFADDFVILCRSRKKAEKTLSDVDSFLRDAALSLHPDKTRIRSFDQGFHFLGHLFVKGIALPANDPLESLPAEEPAPDTPRSTAKATADASSKMQPDNYTIAGPIPDGHHAPRIRTLYIFQKGRRLDLQNQAFAVWEGDKLLFANVPRWIDRIEVGPDIEVSDRAIRHALAHQIPIEFISEGGRPLGQLTPRLVGHGLRHLAQARALLDDAFCLRIAQAMVDAKIRNQKALLYRLNRRRKDAEISSCAHQLGRIVRKIQVAETLDQLRGFEGEAAALYWPALGRTFMYGFGLERRARREQTEPVAFVLDILSHLLTRDIETLLMRAALHPAFGFLHAVRAGAASPLAFDMIEAFRAPLVEGLAVYLFNNRILSNESFGSREDGRRHLYPPARDKLIRHYERWLNRNVRNPATGLETNWRGLIETDIHNLVAAIEQQGEFSPYQMDH